MTLIYCDWTLRTNLTRASAAISIRLMNGDSVVARRSSFRRLWVSSHQISIPSKPRSTAGAPSLQREPHPAERRCRISNEQRRSCQFSIHQGLIRHIPFCVYRTRWNSMTVEINLRGLVKVITSFPFIFAWFDEWKKGATRCACMANRDPQSESDNERS